MIGFTRRSGTRIPAAAGTFYPADPGELAATVDALLANARPAEVAGPVRALIVPHAGYRYSGPVAASGYAVLAADRRRAITRVILLGPSHHEPLDGMAGSPAAYWRTPLGDVPVEHAPGVPADHRPHDLEHALEVQLPFLQRMLGDRFTIVPITVGRAAPGQVADLIDRLESTLPGLVVVSTDLSHYHDARTANRLDGRTVDAVLARDPGAIGPSDACGNWALCGLVEHCRRHDRRLHLLDQRTSADTAGDPHRVVGYAALAVHETPSEQIGGGVRFADRQQAGRLLAERLGHLRPSGAVVVGLPRGGLPVAAEVARALDAPLDVIMVRKLGLPPQPELAMGAIGEDGVRVLNPEVLAESEVTPEQLSRVEALERAELDRRSRLLRAGHRRVPLLGRVVVIVDDGLATGSTARAACQVARAQRAARIVLAVPVAPLGWERRLAGVADELVCLETPEPLIGISCWYARFPQLTDEQAAGYLSAAPAGSW